MKEVASGIRPPPRDAVEDQRTDRNRARARRRGGSRPGGPGAAYPGAVHRPGLLGGNLPLLATFGRHQLTFVVSYTFLYGYTQWLEEGRGLSASAAGLVLLPMFLTAVIVATATGRRTEVRGRLLIGAIAQIVACALLLLVGSGSAIWLLVAVTLIVGVPKA